MAGVGGEPRSSHANPAQPFSSLRLYLALMGNQWKVFKKKKKRTCKITSACSGTHTHTHTHTRWHKDVFTFTFRAFSWHSPQRLTMSEQVMKASAPRSAASHRGHFHFTSEPLLLPSVTQSPESHWGTLTSTVWVSSWHLLSSALSLHLPPAVTTVSHIWSFSRSDSSI